jgi:signal transduction histidine kinase
MKFSDNGVGIDLSKHQGKVFGLYQRFHDEIEGKGLGLFIVKSQIESAGGNIALESKPGVGTTFILTLKR